MPTTPQTPRHRAGPPGQLNKMPELRAREMTSAPGMALLGGRGPGTADTCFGQGEHRSLQAFPKLLEGSGLHLASMLFFSLSIFPTWTNDGPCLWHVTSVYPPDPQHSCPHTGTWHCHLLPANSSRTNPSFKACPDPQNVWKDLAAFTRGCPISN